MLQARCTREGVYVFPIATAPDSRLNAIEALEFYAEVIFSFGLGFHMHMHTVGNVPLCPCAHAEPMRPCVQWGALTGATFLGAGMKVDGGSAFALGLINFVIVYVIRECTGASLCTGPMLRPSALAAASTYLCLFQAEVGLVHPLSP